jgi:signal transduction histidine kinase/ligand-binding sensor domain-containing protein/AraC-like DNA-binding protein
MTSPRYSAFAQDDIGYLWIGTSYGLMRFDGNTFKPYLHNEDNKYSLIDNRVLQIFKDSKGLIWVATANGLQFFDNRHDRLVLINLPDKNFNGYISDIIEPWPDKIMFIASGVGVYLYDKNTGKSSLFDTLETLPFGNQVNKFAKLPDGDFLFSSQQGDLAVYKSHKSIKTIKLCSAPIIKVLNGTDNNTYIVSEDNVWQYSKGKIIKINGLSSEKLTYKDAVAVNDNKIMLTTDKGIKVIDTKSSQLVIADYKIESNNVDLTKSRIATVYQDRDGNIWLGCVNKGIVMLPSYTYPFIFTDLSKITDGYDGYINDIQCDKDLTIWCAIEDRGVYKLNHKGELLLNVDTPYQVRCLHLTQNGRLLAGLNNSGIYEIDKTTGKLKTIAEIEGKFAVTAIVTDTKGDIYAAIDGRGVLHIDSQSGQQQWIIADDNDEMVNNWIPTLCYSKDGELWMGHYSGISCYKSSQHKFATLTHDDLLRQGSCNEIISDNKGNIWIATSHGLVKYNPSKAVISRYTVDNGLSDNSIMGIAIDKNGYIWSCTRFGISRFNPDNGTAVSFMGGRGMSDKSFNNICVDPNGSHLFIAGQQGITEIESLDITPNKFKASPTITDLIINDTPLSAFIQQNDREPIDSDLNCTNLINLEYTDKAVTLNFSTLDFRDGDNVFYEYQISNLSSNWNKTRFGESSIHINNLTPGTYTLRVRAYENGEYSPVREIKICVAQPWFWSTLAKCCYLLILLAIGAQIIMAVRRKRANQINEAKLQFFINISHEIRSPLTLILNPLESLLKQDFDEKTTKRLQAINRNANRILDLINQLLDIRKIDKGKMDIRCTETDMVAYVKDLTDMFQSKAENRKIALNMTAESDNMPVWIDRNNFDKVLINLLTNAFKYTAEGGSIDVELTTGHNPKCKTALRDYLQINVKDTGTGIDEKKAEKIFERFYQDTSRQTDQPIGFGIGLNLCRLLVELHHGEIKASNRHDVQGSCFEVRIPLGDSHLTEAEKQITETASERPEIAENSLATISDSTESHNTKHRSKHQVLIADDDVEMREYLGAYLSNYYKVEAVGDGETAWKAILNGNFDLVISDINMPEMNGLQLLKNIKANGNTNHIPVILLTSKTEYNARKEGWDKGADGYLSKPFNIDELVSLSNNLIDSRIVLRGRFSGAQTQDDKLETIEVKSNDEMLMNKIMETINAHLDDPNLSVETLGQEVGISRAHLHRKMKEMAGITPSDFIRNIRLRQACELLKNTDNDVTQIAYSIGFASQTHFSTVFKKFTGVTPTEYRSKHTADIGHLTESSNSALGHS